MKKVLSLILTLVIIASTLLMPSSANADDEARASGNPVIEGSYADPDIDYFDHKYWIFPTTDGTINETGWWGGKTFSAFSSDDMVNWTNEGVILNVEADTEEQAGRNENGVQIAYSEWSCAHAWAPSIEKIGDKYFFFYVASVKAEYMEKYCAWVDTYVDNEGRTIEGHYVDDKAIGVAVADSPTGPYKAYEEPLLYGKQASEMVSRYNEKQGADYTIPSVIDPSVFVDTGVDANRDKQDDIYISFGNWTPMLVRIKVDGEKITIDDSVYRPVKGVLFGWWQPDDNGFMESLIIFKRNGKYYFTWSVDGTASIGYRVAYGIANSVTSVVDYKGTLLQLDRSKHIYGTAHQSVLHNPVDDKFYICYHRLQVNKENGLQVTPEGELIESGDQGNFRETCIDEITFDKSGYAFSSPTHEGVKPVPAKHDYVETAKIPATCTKDGEATYACEVCEKQITEKLPATGHNFKEADGKPATCTENGEKIFICENCKDKFTEPQYATGHDYDNGKVTKKATCGKSGTKTYTCKSCGATKKETIKATGKHTYDGGKVTKAPTSSKAGEITYTCKSCGKKKTESVPKLAKTSISKLTAKKNGFTASWKKVSSATGYQLEYSTSSKFSNSKKVTITKNSTLSKSVTKLKAKKKYYVRIRTYRTVKGTKYYSSWSGSKAVTTK